VDLSTRVQFPPVTPVMRASFNGENTSILTKKCRFNSGRLFQFCGRSSVELERGFPKPEAAGSIPAVARGFCNARACPLTSTGVVNACGRLQILCNSGTGETV
jgi:hypothetical protein